MESISPYLFGGNESHLRRIHKGLAKFFHEGPVLDIGCGRGFFLESLSQAGVTGVGIDCADAAIRACRQKGLTVHQQDARSFLQADHQSFAGICCSHVIEHMPFEDARQLLELCHSSLRPGGLLLVVTPNPQDLEVMTEMFWLDPSHVRPYPSPLLAAMLRAAGFHIRREEHLLGTWRMVGRRHLPVYWFRRILLGKYFGKPNTLILAAKEQHPAGH